MDSKTFLLEKMHELLSYSVIGDIQYKNRYNGFNGELHFLSWFRANRNSPLCEGGIFIPLKDISDSFEEAIYLIVVPNPISEYHVEQLQAAKPLSKRGQYLITYDSNEHIKEWNCLKIDGLTDSVIPYPSSLKVFTLLDDTLSEIELSELKCRTGVKPAFHKKAAINDSLKNFFIKKLVEYNYEDILNTYLSRFILDGIYTRTNIDRNVQRGAPLDIDAFIYGKNKKWNILEIKEKNLSANGCFGMDVRRINSLKKVAETFSTRAFYIVRKISDQESRSFVSWRIISMDRFDRFASKNFVEGGTGMRSTDSSNPTRLCNESYFKDI